jgi:hypothetical protein
LVYFPLAPAAEGKQFNPGIFLFGQLSVETLGIDLNITTGMKASP